MVSRKQPSHGLSLRLSKEQKASRAFAEHLFSDDIISPEGRDFALETLMPARQWAPWIARLLLLLGSALFLSGVVFFFAFNWASMAPLWKFVIVEGGIVLGAAGAFYFSLKALEGKIAALVAGILVGVFLAVFGQIYQTGANAYSLFIPWMLLILPWVILARFSAYWFVWFAIAQVALLTYWSQGLIPGPDYTLLTFTLCALSGTAFLVFHEMGFGRDKGDGEAEWVRILVVFYVLGMILCPFVYFTFDLSFGNVGAVIGALAALVLCAGAYYIFRWKLVDKIAFTAAVAAIAFAIGTVFTKVLFYDSGRAEYSGLWLLLALLFLGISGTAIIHLRSVYKLMGTDHD